MVETMKLQPKMIFINYPYKSSQPTLTKSSKNIKLSINFSMER